MGGGQGWGRSRRDSLAELGITEEEFEEYAAKKPAGDSDLGVGSLAMGMDVDPATQQPKPRTSALQAMNRSPVGRVHMQSRLPQCDALYPRKPDTGYHLPQCLVLLQLPRPNLSDRPILPTQRQALSSPSCFLSIGGAWDVSGL